MMANLELAIQSLPLTKQELKSIIPQWRYQSKLAQQHRSSLRISQ
jgi:hypothetical protein